MVFEDSIPVFLPALQDALVLFATIFVALGLLGFIGYFFIGTLRYGPAAAGDSLYKLLVRAAIDLVHTSPRRIFALARLALREALRNRVLIVFALFAIVLLFAGWFLDTDNFNPGHLYLNFVLTATCWLVLLLAWLLSCLSLPSDIKSRTIYTVVTKPVRATEIILGRIIGFSAVGTVLIAAMGLCSYIFVVRGLHHTHGIEAADLHGLGDSSGGKEGRTTLDKGHRHSVTLDEKGNGWTDVKQGHRHKVTNIGTPEHPEYVVSEPLDTLTAIVPIYGSLQFFDRAGHPGSGINVGKEWGYRRYIEGGTLAAAVWTFEGITEKQFPQGLPVDIAKIRAFRLHKGNIDQTVLGSIALRNPATGAMSRPVTFQSKEYIDHHFIPRTLERKMAKTAVGQPRRSAEKLDLFEDLVSDGKVEVWIQCDEPRQFLGLAQADVYLKAENASFRLNFIKGYVGIWLQMVLVTAMGVMWSTLLSTPVALLATAGSGLLGFCTQFIRDLHFSETADDAHKTVWGGGPIESLVRLVTQDNLVSKWKDNWLTHAIQNVDLQLLRLLKSLVSLVPDFHKFSDIDYVSSGFNIPGNLLGIHFVYAFGYLMLAFLLAYLFLRTREIAA